LLGTLYSAIDAGGSEKLIRQQLIETGDVEAMKMLRARVSG